MNEAILLWYSGERDLVARNHLIGIDPNGRVHVSERLLMLHDGPLLEQSLRACTGTSEGQSVPDRLGARFEQFNSVA